MKKAFPTQHDIHQLREQIKTSDKKLHGLHSTVITHHNHKIDEHVHHFDASYLEKDIRISALVQFVRVVGGIVATLIGITLFIYIINHVIYAGDIQEKQVAEVLEIPAEKTLPQITSLLAVHSDTADAALTQAGLTHITSQDDEAVFCVGVPNDDISDDTKDVLLSNIGKLQPVEAAIYVPTWWQLEFATKEYTDTKLRFIQFNSNNPVEAIQAALKSQGWVDNKEITTTSDGEDTVGNTFKEGTLQHEGKTYTWRIAACQLKEVYDFVGFPEDAHYVSIHVVAQ